MGLRDKLLGRRTDDMASRPTGAIDTSPGFDAAVPAPSGTWDEIERLLQPAVVLSTAVDRTVLRWEIAGPIVLVASLAGRLVNDADAAMWDVDVNSVMGAAVGRLVGVAPKLEPIFPDAHAWFPTNPPGAQAAWLANPEALLRPVGLGRAIAFVATPEDLVVVDPHDEVLIAQLATSTRQLIDSGRASLCAEAFELFPEGIRYLG